MPKPTLQSLSDKVDNIIDDVHELKNTKANKDIIALELIALKKDITIIQLEQTRVNSYGKWVILLIAGALITAVLNLILRKP